MKSYWKKIIGGISCLFVCCLLTVMALGAKEERQMDVMFLHDTHSHLESFKTIMDGETKIIGGFSKIKTLIQEQEKSDRETLLLDGGDFSMGTLVQTIYEEEAAELRMLGQLGVEATTLGNHEYDYRSKGLANMLAAAKQSGDAVPEIVISNVDWEGMEKAGLTEEQRLLKDAFDAYGIQEYKVITKGDIRIGLLGIFGEDSLECAPTCALQFEDATKAAKRVVQRLEEEENVDLIVCLSHSGTWDEEEKSEDEILAKNVPEIDLIISGHTHSTLEKPIKHGTTYIVSCGEYGKNLGSLTLREAEKGIWELKSYELLPVSEEIAKEQETEEKIATFLQSVNEEYLSRFGYVREQILAENDITFDTVYDLEEIHTEHNLGNLIADAYAYRVGEEVDVAVAPAGTIRDTFAKGDVTAESVFNAFSLGIGPDGIPGYPLVKTYLTGEELKIVAEIDASVSDLMKSARLYMSGLQFEFNPHRMILNKVTDCYLMKNGERVELQDDQLYCVVTDLYSAQMLGAVTDMSFGLLAIEPKTSNGTVVTDYEQLIIKEDGKELKAWTAIAAYMESFADTDQNGVGEVPKLYDSQQGRKVVNDSKSLGDLVKQPNKFAVMIVAVLICLLALVIGIVVLIVKIIRKRKRRKSDPSCK